MYKTLDSPQKLKTSYVTAIVTSLVIVGIFMIYYMGAIANDLSLLSEMISIENQQEFYK